MQNNPYTPPEASIEPQESKVFVLASRWSRLGAAILDSLAVMLVTVPVMYFTGGFERAMNASETLVNTILYAVLGIVIFIVVNGRLLALSGQTVGKWLLNIRIADLNGELPTVKKHILPRYLFSMLIVYVPFIGGLLSIINVLFIFSERKQCLHDRVANTIVINEA